MSALSECTLTEEECDPHLWSVLYGPANSYPEDSKWWDYLPRRSSKNERMRKVTTQDLLTKDSAASFLSPFSSWTQYLPKQTLVNESIFGRKKKFPSFTQSSSHAPLEDSSREGRELQINPKNLVSNFESRTETKNKVKKLHRKYIGQGSLTETETSPPMEHSKHSVDKLDFVAETSVRRRPTKSTFQGVERKTNDTPKVKPMRSKIPILVDRARLYSPSATMFHSKFSDSNTEDRRRNHSKTTVEGAARDRAGAGSKSQTKSDPSYRGQHASPVATGDLSQFLSSVSDMSFSVYRANKEKTVQLAHDVMRKQIEQGKAVFHNALRVCQEKRGSVATPPTLPADNFCSAVSGASSRKNTGHFSVEDPDSEEAVGQIRCLSKTDIESAIRNDIGARRESQTMKGRKAVNRKSLHRSQHGSPMVKGDSSLLSYSISNRSLPVNSADKRKGVQLAYNVMQKQARHEKADISHGALMLSGEGREAAATSQVSSVSRRRSLHRNEGTAVHDCYANSNLPSSRSKNLSRDDSDEEADQASRRKAASAAQDSTDEESDSPILKRVTATKQKPSLSSQHDSLMSSLTGSTTPADHTLSQTYPYGSEAEDTADAVRITSDEKTSKKRKYQDADSCKEASSSSLHFLKKSNLTSQSGQVRPSLPLVKNREVRMGMVCQTGLIRSHNETVSTKQLSDRLSKSKIVRKASGGGSRSGHGELPKKNWRDKLITGNSHVQTATKKDSGVSKISPRQHPLEQPISNPHRRSLIKEMSSNIDNSSVEDTSSELSVAGTLPLAHSTMIGHRASGLGKRHVESTPIYSLFASAAGKTDLVKGSLGETLGEPGIEETEIEDGEPESSDKRFKKQVDKPTSSSPILGGKKKNVKSQDCPRPSSDVVEEDAFDLLSFDMEKFLDKNPEFKKRIEEHKQDADKRYEEFKKKTLRTKTVDEYYGSRSWRNAMPPKKQEAVPRRVVQNRRVRACDLLGEDGKPYKTPRLVKPAYWVTDSLYNTVIKSLTPKHGIKARVKAEEVVVSMAKLIKTILRRKNQQPDLIEELLKVLYRAGLIKSYWDYCSFCHTYFPIVVINKLISIARADPSLILPIPVADVQADLNLGEE